MKYFTVEGVDAWLTHSRPDTAAIHGLENTIAEYVAEKGGFEQFDPETRAELAHIATLIGSFPSREAVIQE